MARAVGIDLGTTDSVVSVLEGGEHTVITNRTARAPQRIGTALYESSRAEQPAGAAGATATAGEGAAGGSSEDDVVDAKIVDDDKPEAG
ncbi:molecular chaperone DnaK (HSP70) [Streptomyces africanus]|uniref:Molecular chaperone DnaK (HSP70) n=1 Tax=Streptomyces africanus TaxID=231024 RepID=A0ABU0QFZ0_9ACTN|nr:Hsp70 family protein [Streptomyces africanus]MDQ0746070.1 molecular chaperone DnaK (HSP70) [Streptomyces africanus]